jgi:hypothetical protein
MTYAFEMVSGFIKIGSGNPKLIVGIHRHTDSLEIARTVLVLHLV